MDDKLKEFVLQLQTEVQHNLQLLADKHAPVAIELNFSIQDLAYHFGSSVVSVCAAACGVDEPKTDQDKQILNDIATSMAIGGKDKSELLIKPTDNLTFFSSDTFSSSIN